MRGKLLQVGGLAEKPKLVALAVMDLLRGTIILCSVTFTESVATWFLLVAADTFLLQAFKPSSTKKITSAAAFLSAVLLSLGNLPLLLSFLFAQALALADQQMTIQMVLKDN